MQCQWPGRSSVSKVMHGRLNKRGYYPSGGYSYVFKQPTTPEEEALCKEAMEGCPVEAIGNNGEG